MLRIQKSLERLFHPTQINQIKKTVIAPSKFDHLKNDKKKLMNKTKIKNIYAKKQGCMGGDHDKIIKQQKVQCDNVFYN